MKENSMEGIQNIICFKKNSLQKKICQLSSINKEEKYANLTFDDACKYTVRTTTCTIHISGSYFSV